MEYICHDRDLGISLQDIGLIDADCVNPEVLRLQGEAPEKRSMLFSLADAGWVRRGSRCQHLQGREKIGRGR